MTIRCRMSSIMGITGQQHPELSALELRKIAEFDFVLASTNMNQSAPNFIKRYVTIRSWMSSNIDLIGPELSELSVLDLEKMPYLNLFTL